MRRDTLRIVPKEKAAQMNAIVDGLSELIRAERAGNIARCDALALARPPHPAATLHVATLDGARAGAVLSRAAAPGHGQCS